MSVFEAALRWGVVCVVQAEAVDELLVSMGMARRDGSTGEVQSAV